MRDPFGGVPLGEPALDRRDPDRTPRGVVLMLHGGTQHSVEPVGPRSASLWRTALMRDAIAPRLLASGHAVWLLRHGLRGWNDSRTAGGAPVPEARWALDRVRAAYGEVPVVLLGHSMGGRTAVHAADHPNVVGVVGLAPWLSPRDPVSPLAGRELVAGHGRRDRITSARATQAYVERARSVAVRAEFHSLGWAGHYLLYRPRRWNRFALTHSLEMLTRTGSPARARDEIQDAVGRPGTDPSSFRA